MSKQFDQQAFVSKSIIHVGGLHPFTTAENLQNIFITFGQIVKVSVPIDDSREVEKSLGIKLDFADGLDETVQNENEPKQQRNKGFGLIEFEDPLDAEHAVMNMNDSELFGLTLRVSIAQSNAQKGKAKWDVVTTKTSTETTTDTAD